MSALGVCIAPICLLQTDSTKSPITEALKTRVWGSLLHEPNQIDKNCARCLSEAETSFLRSKGDPNKRYILQVVLDEPIGHWWAFIVDIIDHSIDPVMINSTGSYSPAGECFASETPFLLRCYFNNLKKPPTHKAIFTTYREPKCQSPVFMRQADLTTCGCWTIAAIVMFFIAQQQLEIPNYTSSLPNNLPETLITQIKTAREVREKCCNMLTDGDLVAPWQLGNERP